MEVISLEEISLFSQKKKKKKKNDLKTYGNIRNISTGQENNFKTGCLSG